MALGTTPTLLTAIRRHTGLPATHPSYTDALTLADATEEVYGFLLPLGLGERQELWAGPTGRLRVPVLEGVAAYAIPGRAVGGKLRNVRLVGPRGEATFLDYYGREEVGRARDTGGVPSGLVVEGSTFRLFPTPRGLPGYVLEVDVYVRPGELVLPAACAQVGQVTTASGSTTLVVSRTSDNEALFNAETLDVVSSRAPFDTAALEALVVSVDLVGGSVWEVTLDGELDVAVGDWLCLSGQSPYLQAPVEWLPMLALRVAVRQLTSFGDVETAGVKQRLLTDAEKRAPTLIRPRREDVARKVPNGMDRWRRPVWDY